MLLTYAGQQHVPLLHPMLYRDSVYIQQETRSGMWPIETAALL